MAISLGITGGIGSGKSTVCNVFKLLGTPVFEADKVAKSLINSNSKIRNGLIEMFGSEIYDTKDNIDRKMLANHIFNDNNLLEKVNQLIHPEVRKEFNRWKEIQKHPYVIHEAAILFESGFYKMMDFTILVSARLEARIERVSKRDKISAELVRQRINNQFTDEQKRELASLELVNDNKNLLIPQILEIDKKLRIHGKIW